MGREIRLGLNCHNRVAVVLDHATSEIAMGTKLGIDATSKLSGEGFRRPWPPLIRMSENVRQNIDALFGNKR